MITIRIVDWSATPGGRTKRDGPFSGEEFLRAKLQPAFESARANEKVTVDLDGVAGLPPSFLEQAFGGLVRALKIAPEALLKRLEVVTTEADLMSRVRLIKRFILEAKPELA